MAKKKGPVILHDQSPAADLRPPPGRKTGLIPRDYTRHPPGYQACTEVFPDGLLIPQGEYAARLADQVANKASLFDLREANYEVLKSLDQDGLGLCWAFSSTKSVMYLRTLMGEPAQRLSAWWVAGKVKNWRDEGGWGAESLEWIASKGVPTEALCPSYKSSYDTPQTQANAALHRAIEWWDGTDDTTRNTAIMISAFLMGLAPVLDFNYWSHSVCGCRLVSLSPLTIDIDNSWGESAGDRGIYRLTGSKAVPDGIVVPRVVLPSQE